MIISAIQAHTTLLKCNSWNTLPLNSGMFWRLTGGIETAVGVYKDTYELELDDVERTC